MHLALASELTLTARFDFLDDFYKDLCNLISTLNTIVLTGDYTMAQEAFILGHGEKWSTKLVSLLLRETLSSEADLLDLKILALNANEILTVMNNSGEDLSRVRRHLKRHLHDEDSSPRNQLQSHASHQEDCWPFLPSFSRLNLTAANAPVAQPLDSCQRLPSNSREEYSIGPLNLTPGTLNSTEELEFASWAFPPLHDLPPDLLPPTFFANSHHAPDYQKIDWHASYEAFAKWFFEQEQAKAESAPVKRKTVYVLLITGFIAKSQGGLPATLGRNGSDSSAVAFGALLRAEGVTIWSDVAGIYTGDPRFVRNDFITLIAFSVLKQSLWNA